MNFSLHQAMSSQITHTIIEHTPLSTYTRHLPLDFQQLCPFYSLSQPYHVTASHPLQVTTNRAREGGTKEHRANQRHQHETHSVTYVPGLSTLSYFSRIVGQASTVIPLLPKVTFRPSIQRNLGLPRIRPSLTSAIHTLIAVR